MAGIEIFADRKPLHRRTWTIAAIFLTIVFMALGQLITIFGILLPLGYHQADLEKNWWPTFYLLLGFGFTSVLVFAWVFLFERRNLATIGFNANGLGRYIKGFGLGLGFVIATVSIIYAFGGYRIEKISLGALMSVSVLLPIGLLLVGFIIQGATEEILVRGWLMQIISSRHGIGWGVGATSLIFSLMHGGNMSKLTPEFALGLLNIVLFALFMGFYAIKEGALWGVCAWHSAWNWLLGVGFGLEVSGQAMKINPLLVDLAYKPEVAWWITGKDFGPEGSVVTTIILLVAVIWLLKTGVLTPKHNYSVITKTKDEAA